MSSDIILRALGALRSFRDTLPKGSMVDSKWAENFHQIVDQLQEATGLDLSEYRVRETDIRSISNTVITGHYPPQTYTQPGMWCDGAVLCFKVEAIENYLQLKIASRETASEKRAIGFGG